MSHETVRNEKFAQLLVGVQKPLRGYVFAHVPDAATAEDIVQEVSLILWRKQDRYDSARPFTGWALGIARYQIMSSRRQSASSRLLFDDALARKLATVYEETEPELEERRIMLMECLKHLSAGARKIMEMRYGQGLRVKKMAAMQGKTVTALNTAIHRIRRALLDCVDHHTGEDVGMAGGWS